MTPSASFFSFLVCAPSYTKRVFKAASRSVRSWTKTSCCLRAGEASFRVDSASRICECSAKRTTVSFPMGRCEDGGAPYWRVEQGGAAAFIVGLAQLSAREDEIISKEQ